MKYYHHDLLLSSYGVRGFLLKRCRGSFLLSETNAFSVYTTRQAQSVYPSGSFSTHRVFSSLERMSKRSISQPSTLEVSFRYLKYWDLQDVSSELDNLVTVIQRKSDVVLRSHEFPEEVVLDDVVFPHVA